MMKHIGKHNNRKIVVVFRKVPGEDHLALVIYADLIPTQIHDDVMKVLESDVGQQENEFANALHRSVLTDGRNALGAVHAEGYMKKVQTNQIIMTPNAQSTVRLDELNTIVDEINVGEEARKKLADNDAARGMVDPTARHRAETAVQQSGAMSDNDVAMNLMAQAEKMEQEAQSMLNEAKRMIAEAKDMMPKPKKVAATRKKATTTRGRKKTTKTTA